MPTKRRWFRDAISFIRNAITVDGLHFAGFSGCPTRWGRNPVAVVVGDEHDPSHNRRILQINRAELQKTAAALDPRRTIVMTHERLSRLSDVTPDALLHLYGHVHGFSERTRGTTRFVNVSVLDRPITVHSRQNDRADADDCRNLNAGNYVIIEIDRAGKTAIRPVTLPHDHPAWTPVDGFRINGLPWIPEEAEWTSPTDPRLRRYRETLRR